MRTVVVLCLLSGLTACSSETPNAGVVSPCNVESDCSDGQLCVDTTAQASRGSGGPDKRGVELGEVRLVSDHTKDDMRGSVVVSPPGALNDRWSRRLPDPITAMASGWMRVRQRARQRNVELPLIISDHADWGELTRTIEEVDPVETWITHGREDALLRWCQLHQRRARALAMVGYEDEDD